VKEELATLDFLDRWRRQRRRQRRAGPPPGRP
jgi:hypothetical protein